LPIPSNSGEGIGRLFKEVYEEVCGGYEALRSRSYVTKIHHREMPRLLRRGEVEAAVMWSTEAAYWGFPHTRPEPAKRGRLELGLASEAGRSAYEAFKRLEVEALYKRYGFKRLR
ncbi:MAG: ABC transporter substrate-binding protein, partial [Thermoproteus sp.]|nr:ABC transporter substrate-binding protein [Thermoproteus sp.]